MFVISIGKIGEWYMDLLKDNNCYFLVNSYYLEKNNLLNTCKLCVILILYGYRLVVLVNFSLL